MSLGRTNLSKSSSRRTIESVTRSDELISFKNNSLISISASDWSIGSAPNAYLSQSETRPVALRTELG